MGEPNRRPHEDCGHKRRRPDRLPGVHADDAETMMKVRLRQRACCRSLLAKIFWRVLVLPVLLRHYQERRHNAGDHHRVSTFGRAWAPGPGPGPGAPGPDSSILHEPWGTCT